jgi:hypothetical protein
MKRPLLLAFFLLILIVAGWYGYNKLYGKVESLQNTQADFTMTADELIAAFEKDSATANKQYLGKIVAITGSVKSVEQEAADATVVLGKEGEMSSVRCSMDSTQVAPASNLKAGSTVTIKGACTGFHADDMGLGSDVVLNRCVIETNK